VNVDQMLSSTSIVFIVLIFIWGFWTLLAKPLGKQGRITPFMWVAFVGFSLRFVFSLHMGTENIQTMLGALFAIDVFVLLTIALLEIGGSLLFTRAKKDPRAETETKPLEP
jgi:heme/copper-type cytochrome/quinol oxidase subunit 4